MAILLITIVVTMGISFLCSVLEACLLSLSLADIGRMAEKRPLAARIWKNFKSNIERPIAVILIINTFSHTVGAALSGAKFEELFGPKWIIVFSIAFSLAMIQWTEILPKTLGVRYNKGIAVLSASPLKYLVSLFSPFVSVVHFLNRPFEYKKGKGAESGPIEDISVLARFAALDNIINKDQETILSQTVKLSEKRVSDVMVKREEMKDLSTDMSLTDALLEAHLHHHTRFPLVRGGNKDDVVGYVNFKDIVSALQTNPRDPSLQGICRPVLEVKENESVAGLLGKIRRSYQHMAIVRHEDGGVAGLVTLEDVIEAIMGDIEDEYDLLPAYVYQIADNRWVAGGGVDLETLKEKTGEDIPVVKKSLNSWLMELSGKAPQAEEEVRYKNYVFILRKIRRSHIYEVILETGRA
ncbi:MAG: hemolysin family protein [Candidatus Omnitrophica bacterium]|nr:hemolysin family protein [Candidatus Omnitrophota bacterium]MDD5574643.1 hemolysin family protein [Candidatus Omnitrophota bacterium]